MANCALGKIEDFVDSKPSCNFVPAEIDEVSIAFGIENLIFVPEQRSSFLFQMQLILRQSLQVRNYNLALSPQSLQFYLKHN